MVRLASTTQPRQGPSEYVFGSGTSEYVLGGSLAGLAGVGEGVVPAKLTTGHPGLGKSTVFKGNSL